MNKNSLLASISQEKRALIELALLNRRKLAQPASGPASGPPRLSPAQESIWFLDQLEPDSALYNMPAGFRIRGPLDVNVMRKAMDEIVRRHEPLRTNIVPRDGKPAQLMANRSALEMPLVDLSGLPEPERSAQANRFMDNFACRPFNLASDLLLRCAVLRLGKNEHWLLFSLHHIAADNWSFGVMFDELSRLYEAFAEGKPSPLPALPMRYSEYAARQRQRVDSQEIEVQVNYWKQQLAGDLPLLELPADFPRPPRQTFAGNRVFFTLPPILIGALQDLSRGEKTTLFTALLAAFQALLHRLSRQETILVGSPVGARSQVETEKLVGYFLNTVVLRADFPETLTFQNLLRQTRDRVLGALSHQDVPLEKLVEALKVQRSPGHNPLFQALFQLLPGAPPAPRLPGSEVEPIPMDTGVAKFDITLSLTGQEGGLLGEWEYNTALFKAETIHCMAAQYLTLLEGIVNHPEATVTTLPLLTEEEKERIIIEWNQTTAEFPEEITVPELFEKQVAATPDAVALVFEGREMTFRELNRRANQVAHALRKMKVAPDTLVGICMEPCLEMVVAIHGVLKAGAAYVPFDPSNPADRLKYLVDDARVPVVLAQARHAGIIPEKSATVFCLDRDWDAFEQESAENPERVAKGRNLAYVIYTSGSTGQPKGVMISHTAICNHLFWFQREFPLSEKDRILQKTVFSFDASVWEFLAPPCFGARLYLARPEAHRDPEQLTAFIAANQITFLQLVPSQLAALVQEPGLAQCRCLRRITCGGEALAAEVARKCKALLPDTVLANQYGPTEATIDATCHVWTGNEPDYGIVTIGKPIANAQAYILDPQFQPVPVGVAGELCIGGRGLARGYWNRPELTAEKFVPHPFSKDPDDRIYRTGDLARYLPDGNIAFIGRLDHQVKLRGFRIELGEIETALRQLPNVREAVVVVRDEPNGNRRLAGYIVPVQEPPPEASKVRAALRQKLPDYMVPAVIVPLKALPLTPNLKVDRAALPAPEETGFDEPTRVAPQTPIQETLAAIWREVLGVGSVGIHDNFFELGGHSLLATQVVSRIRKHGHDAVNLRDLFEAPTIADLSAIIEKQPATGTAAAATPALKALPRKARPPAAPPAQ